MSAIATLRGQLRRQTNRLLERLAGVRIYSIKAHGREDWFDIRKSGACIETVFDVGANVGQSALKFRSAFPAARIHCFEPVSSCFDALKSAVAGDSRIHCYKSALGSQRAESRIFLTDHSTTSSMIRPENCLGHEDVVVDTLDQFAADAGIQRIDLLKVDAEGFDLEVLRGADRLLDSGRVALVLVEVGFHPGDARHVLFDDVRDYLMQRGFHVYGFYDQNLEWGGESRLRFANVCFTNESAFVR